MENQERYEQFGALHSTDGRPTAAAPLTGLYAKIKRTSKYADQARSKDPFPVEVNGRTDAYIFHGNDNDYRPEDLNLYVKVGAGCPWQRWVKVS